MTGTFENVVSIGLRTADYQTFKTADSALVAGQEVYISGDKTVAKRTSTTQLAIGILVSAPDNDLLVNVRTTLFRDSFQATAKGGALAAGALVRQDGTVDSNGKPNYIATTTGHVASAIVLSGGAENAEITVGVLHSPRVI